MIIDHNSQQSSNLRSKILHIETPLVDSLPLQELTNKQILLKMECDQPTGSFKIRGIGALAQEFITKGYENLVSSSGGNAGYAVGYVAKKLGVKATVFVPKNTPEVYLKNIALTGVEVRMEGDVWDDAHQAAMEFVLQTHAAYIPPFDHPTIWRGHSTMIDEIVDQCQKPDAIIAAVGGGGLMCGILEGLQRNGWSDVDVFSVETEGAASFAKSVKAGRIVTLEKIDTIATTLGAKRIASELFEWSQHRKITPLVVTDLQAITACTRFVNDHRALVEPACGAPLSVVYELEKFPALQSAKSILVIVCGGIGISLKLLEDFTKRAHRS